MAERTLVDMVPNSTVLGNFAKDYTEDKESKTATFVAPVSAAAFAEYIASLDAPNLEDAYKLYVKMVENRAVANARESAVANSTIVVINGERRDLMALALRKRLNALNAYYILESERHSKDLTKTDDVAWLEGSHADSDGDEKPNVRGLRPYRNARNKTIESGEATLEDGLLVAV